MAVNKVGNIAPFINDIFTITSPWWIERADPITGELKIHRGLDISTGDSKPVYSILNGIIHSKGTDDSRGNWVIIYDNNPTSNYYGYATLYLHLAEPVELNINDKVITGQYIAMEGTTGYSTGIHLHIEMQNINLFNMKWHYSYNKSDYIDPAIFMGIDNIDNTQWLYDGIPYVPPTPSKTEKKNFKWVLYAKKLRNRKIY